MFFIKKIMDLEVDNSYLKNGLVILRGKGYFGGVDKDRFFGAVKNLAGKNISAIAYDFNGIHTLTASGVECLVEANKRLNCLSIEDYIILPTSKNVRDEIISKGVHGNIYFETISGILRRIKSPLWPEPRRVEKSCRKRLGLEI